MTITTSRGQTFDVNWAWASHTKKQLRIELNDTRCIADIAADFDGLETISRKSDTEGDKLYEGYNRLTAVLQNTASGTVQLILEKAVTTNG